MLVFKKISLDYGRAKQINDFYGFRLQYVEDCSAFCIYAFDANEDVHGVRPALNVKANTLVRKR